MPGWNVRRSFVAASVLTLSMACSDPGCANTALQDIPSPDGRQHAVVFTRDCGATTASSTQVSVVADPSKIVGSGNLFVADADHGRAPAGGGGGPEVAARWVGARTLEIRYDPRARIFRHDSARGDIRILYRVDSSGRAAP